MGASQISLALFLAASACRGALAGQSQEALTLSLVARGPWEKASKFQVTVQDEEKLSIDLTNSKFGGHTVTVNAGNHVKITVDGRDDLSKTFEVPSDAGGSVKAGALKMSVPADEANEALDCEILYAITPLHHQEALSDFVNLKVAPLLGGNAQHDIDHVVALVPDLWAEVVEAHKGWFVTVFGDAFSAEASGAYKAVKLTYKWYEGKAVRRKKASLDLDDGSVFGMWSIPEAEGYADVVYTKSGQRPSGSVLIRGPGVYKVLMGGEGAPNVVLVVHRDAKANSEFVDVILSDLEDYDKKENFWGSGWNEAALSTLWLQQNGNTAENLHSLGAVGGSVLAAANLGHDGEADADVADVRKARTNIVVYTVLGMIAVLAVCMCCFCGGQDAADDGASETLQSSEVLVAPSVHGDAWPVESVRCVELQEC